MATKHSVVLAAGVAAAFVASSAAFGVANGVFTSRPADEIGHFEMNEHVSSTTSRKGATTTSHGAPTIVATAPQRVTRTHPPVTPDSPVTASTPSVHVSVTTAPPPPDPREPEHEHEDGTEHNDD